MQTFCNSRFRVLKISKQSFSFIHTYLYSSIDNGIIQKELTNSMIYRLDEMRAFKKGEQARFKQYFEELQKSSRQSIKKMVSQLSQSPKNVDTNIINMLKLLLQPMTIDQAYTRQFDRLFKEIFNILKETLNVVFANLSAEERIFYENISKTNRKLSTVAKLCKGLIQITSDYTIEELFHLDIVSLFLQQNKLFKQNQRNYSLNLWNTNELKQISLLNMSSAGKLYKIYSDSSSYLKFPIHQKINGIIGILSLIKIRIILYNFCKKSYKNIPYLLNMDKLIQKQSQGSIDSENSENQPIFKFNFCQIAYFAWSKYQQLPPNLRIQIDKIFQITVNQSQLEKKTYLTILAQNRTRTSFKAPFSSITYSQESDEKQLISDSEEILGKEDLKDKEEDELLTRYSSFQELQDRWNFMSLKLKLKSNSDVLNLQYIGSKVTHSINKGSQKIRLRDYLVVTALNRFSYTSKIIETLLFLESKIHLFLVIKTYEIHYQNLRGGSIQSRKNDISTKSITLATVGSKVLFYFLMQEKRPLGYYKKIKEGIYNNLISQKFVTILFEYDIHHIFPWQYHESLVGNMAKRYDSRVYISSTNEFCEENMLIFAYLHCHLQKIFKNQTKQHFDSTLEKEVKNKLESFK